jgi:hypothetical protein
MVQGHNATTLSKLIASIDEGKMLEEGALDFHTGKGTTLREWQTFSLQNWATAAFMPVECQ